MSLRACWRNYAIFLTVGLLLLTAAGNAQPKPVREYYEINIYHFKDSLQEQKLDDYFAHAFLPALHRQSLSLIGVLKPVANDTAADKRIYVIIPAPSAEKLSQLPAQMEKDAKYQTDAKEYNGIAYTNAPYIRIETVLAYAFPLAPVLQLPKLSGPREQQVYEFRSYESATEELNRNKVRMFNEGGEITLFKRLAFNAVFYANVIAGSRMPNLVYMTSFDNMQAREAHWKTFGDDPEWKRLSALAEYQHNVSHADIILMHPTAYSEW